MDIHNISNRIHENRPTDNNHFTNILNATIVVRLIAICYNFIRMQMTSFSNFVKIVIVFVFFIFYFQLDDNLEAPINRRKSDVNKCICSKKYPEYNRIIKTIYYRYSETN